MCDIYLLSKVRSLIIRLRFSQNPQQQVVRHCHLHQQLGNTTMLLHLSLRGTWQLCDSFAYETTTQMLKIPSSAAQVSIHTVTPNPQLFFQHRSSRNCQIGEPKKAERRTNGKPGVFHYLPARACALCLEPILKSVALLVRWCGPVDLGSGMVALWR